jgi:hypothetical protein
MSSLFALFKMDDIDGPLAGLFFWLLARSRGRIRNREYARNRAVPTRLAQWHVVGTYPSGQQERITGFKTEADALDWLANDSAAWLEKQRSR